MNAATLSVLSILIISCSAQRSPYAGRAPIGYPSLTPTTTTTTAEPLGNRFGEDISTTTIRLPIEARGDAELYKRLLKLPVDKQPFWVINWQALEAHRQKPQTYIPRNNEFVEENILNLRG